MPCQLSALPRPCHAHTHTHSQPTSICVASKCASTHRRHNSHRERVGAGNVLNISILFGLHVTGVLPDVSPQPPPPPSLLPTPLWVSECKETAVYICHLGISFHLTLLALIFCRHSHCCIPPSHRVFTSFFMRRGQMCEWNTVIRQDICINKYKCTYGNGNGNASGRQSELSVSLLSLDLYYFIFRHNNNNNILHDFLDSKDLSI